MKMPFKTLRQFLVPQHLLTAVMGWLAECKVVWFKNWAIKRFIRKYHVDIRDAAIEDISAYANFNSFFIRKLKSDARPIVNEPQQIACPADGTISQIGQIEKTSLFQAKNFHYSLNALLGNQPTLAHTFQHGRFATIYLAPKDYHRVHMPFTGTLRKTIFIPGKLFSVNTLTTESIPHLFARNERLVCVFDTTAGPMIVILVGAMLVGSINTTWQSMPYRSKQILEENFLEGITLHRGEELGYFKLGSTVIVLFPEKSGTWLPELCANAPVRMGQLMGHIKKE